MKHLLFFAGHSSGGRAERFKKMKTFFKNLMPMLLLVAGLGISPNLWADSGFFSDGQWKAGFNNGSDFWKGYNNDGTTEDLGIQTSLKLIGCNVMTWGDVKTNLDWWISFDSEPTTRNDGQNNFWSIYVDWNGDHENYLDNNDYDMIANATHNPGNNTFYMKWTLRNYNTSTGAAKIKFTIPGFSKTTVDAKEFSTAVGGEGQSKTISFTQHYGNSLSTSNCSITGTNESDFSVTSISETDVMVKFKPSTIGTKNATLTITDAHGKTCTITLQGEANDPLSTGVTLRGSFNDWSTTANEFRRATAGATTATVTLNLSAKQSGRFLVYVDGDKYGNSGTILSSTNSAWGFNKDGADCYFNTACAGTYTFTWDITNKKLSVTYPEETHPSSNYVYFLDDNNWGCASAHLYDTGDNDKITNWPGQPLRTVTIDGKTYYLCAPGAKQKVIFTDNTTSKRVPNSEPADATTGGAKYLNAKTTGKTWSAFEFAVTIDKNGGDANGSAVAKFGDNKFKSGNTFVKPTKTGYSAKFTTDQAGNIAFSNGSEGSTFASNTTYTDASGNWNYNKSDGTLYAQWTANKYTVTFDQTGCTASQYTSLQFTYDAKLNTIGADHRPTPPIGYDFLGYSTKDGTNGDWGELLTDGEGHWKAVEGYTAQVGSDIVWKCELTKLYSKIAPQTYNITYKDQGDRTFSGNWGETEHPTTHTYNTATTLVDAPNKTGYTFGGWFTSSNCEGAAITELGATTYTADITLYAKWNPTTTAITIDRQDGSATKNIIATYDGSISAVTGLADTDYQRTGYTFNGMRVGTDKNSAQVIIRSNDDWAFQANAGSSTYTNGANPPVWKYTPSTLTLYTRWDAKQYTITLDDNGGTGGSSSIQATYDSNTGIASGVTKPSNDPQIFAGYWTKNGTSDSDWGVQVIGNDGKFIINAGTGAYTDASGNWKYADNITLFAKWDAPAAYVVNFSVIDNVSGTLTAVEKGSAPVKEITSGDEIDAGTVITLTFTPNDGTYKFGGSAIKGWKLDGWYSDVEHTQLLKDAAGSNSYDYTVPTNASSVYAYAPKVLNTFAIAVADGQSEMGSVNINQGTAGPAQYQEITANPTTPGYHFVNWTQTSDNYFAFVEGTSATDATAKVALKNQSGQTITANFKINDYTITYTGLLDGSTHTGNPETYTIETPTITFNPATSVFGHKFTGWNPASIATGSTGDKTITAQYGDVNLAPVASDNIIEGKQATITPNLTAPTGTYHYEYTCAGITFNVDGSGVATFNAPAAGNYTITANVYEGSNNTGVKLATTPVNITVAEDLSSNWYLAGNGVFGGWGYEQAINMTKKPGESMVDKFYAEIEITTLKDEEFKLLDHSTTKYWTAENHWVNREYPHHDVEQKDGENNNMIFKPDMVGTYQFMLDCTEGKHKLTVTFPTTTTYNVDIYYDGITKTTVEGGAFAKSITANVPQSMRFDHWVVEGETTHVNITDVNSQTTTFTASGTGAIIRAKFKVVGVMYLKASDVFGDAYVNFYSKDGYWSDDKGSGNKGSNCMSRNNHMTKIGKTDIYYLDVSGGISNWTWEQAFSFVNKSVEHDNFSLCNVVYRSDYNDRLPLYVPRYGYITNYFINCHYYNDGIWMKYNDTYSGYKLWIKEKNAQDATAQDVMLTALTPGGYEFNTTLALKSGTTYELKIHNENGEWYGVSKQTITASSCTNWHFWKDNDNCQLTASDAGEYTFTLNLGSGEVIISVQYPLAANDYRVIAKDGDNIVKYGDLIKNSGEATQKDTVSFFNSNYTFRLQKYAGNDTWNEYGEAVTPTAEGSQVGVIDLIVTQDGQGNATLAYKGIYTGNYYIRTDGVDGGWGDYKNNSDNKMDNYGSLIDADPTYQYDVYKAKWILSGKNVKFRVANDYSKAISDEFTTDAIIDNKETLPEGANVRFMWNSTTNQLKRAYLSGSAIPSDRYLILEGDAKMFDKDGNPLNISDLNPNELNFEDKNNWVYQADIQAQPGCEVKLTAKYNGNIQYFIGSENTKRKIIDGSGEGKYSLRAVYDFKTNRLVTGWIPGDTVKGNIVLGSDMLIERTEQGDASQIVFGGASAASLSISNIQHIYGVLKLTKESMLTATESTFDKCVYWISFPFDVKVSEIFGVEKYGEVWAITKYNGEKRAEKGWFKQDTQTFWEFLKPSDIMKANVGYTLNLDPDYFNKESSEPWKSSATEVAWYFPSMEENVGVVSLAQKDTTLKPLHCDIDREFNAGTESEPRIVNHKFTDSNWRVIGVPAFQNLQAPNFEPAPTDGGTFGLKGFYKWVPESNTYIVQSTSDYTFKATGAYMVQYEGKITWSDAAVITTSNKAPWNAPEYAYADAKNYSIRLEFGNDDYTDQTFITLIEKASTDFVLNEDMMKIDNDGFPNIYSFAGAYDVAYNETTFDNQSVMLGVSAPKNGSYTFAMPKDFSGKAVLVDLESGEATDLNLSDYTVELNKGTYNNRFQLVLEVEAKTPTAIDNAEGKWSVDGKTKKLLINDQIYLINGGRVYNAIGTKLR